MRETYFILIKKKAELTKGIVFLVLLICYSYLGGVLDTVLTRRFSPFNRIYVCRLAFFALLTGLTVWICIRFLCYIKKNWESLFLLGITPVECLLLFFLTNTEVLFLQLYLGTILFRIQGAEGGAALALNVLWSLLICLVGVMLGLKAHTGSLTVIGSVLGAGLAFLLGTGRLNYSMVSGWVMSESIGGMFGENYCFFVLFFLCLPILWLLELWMYQRADLSVIADSQYAFRTHWLGDLFHRLSRWCIWEKNYIWIYRNREFLFWKLSAGVFFALVCCLSESFLAVFLTAYGICLVTSFYLLEIYRFERRNFLIYYMSDYSYPRLLRDEVWGGFWLLGDHIFLLFALLRLRNGTQLFYLLLLVAVIFLLSVFVNASLFAFYPKKQCAADICVTLLKLHLPVVQVWFLYQWIQQGKRNWEHLGYEYRA